MKNYSYELKRILSQKTKYDWQEKIKEENSYHEDNTGLNLFMARTGTGKTKAQYDRVIHYKKIGKKTVTLYVPNHCKYLSKQTKDKFLEYFEKDKIETLDVTVGDQTILEIDGFTCIIKPFIPNTDCPTIILDDLDETHPIIFDEFDAIQTQFGLIHGACSTQHSKSTLGKGRGQHRKKKFNILEEICNKTTVDCFSATLDETICKDLLPYTGIFHITVYLVEHQKELLDNVNINYETHLNSKLITLYKNNKKTIVFVPTISAKKKLGVFLDTHSILYYGWDSTSNEKFDDKKVRTTIISVFVNGPSRGLDIPEIECVVLDRSLTASTKVDKSDISGLANQIMGRLRGGGQIYRSSTNFKNKPNNLYDLVEKIYENVRSDDHSYNILCWGKKNEYQKNVKKNDYLKKNDYIKNVVDLFIYYLIIQTDLQNVKVNNGKGPNNGKGYNNGKGSNNGKGPLKGDSIRKRLIEELSDDTDLMDKMNYIRKEIENKNLSDGFIEKYYTIEEILEKQYEKEYKNMVKIPEMYPILFQEKTKLNKTGGGDSKPNISEAEKQKGIRYLGQAIKNRNLDGCSLFIISQFSDDIYKGEFMHAKPKSKLSYIERTKSMFAIPMADNMETGLNQSDKDTEILTYNDISGININYEKLKEFIGKKMFMLRPEEEIKCILTEYNRLQRFDEN
jgi:hypothetical protein